MFYMEINHKIIVDPELWFMNLIILVGFDREENSNALSLFIVNKEFSASVWIIIHSNASTHGRTEALTPTV
jgi:hypothetical protein